jgi:hypothetical protein
MLFYHRLVLRDLGWPLSSFILHAKLIFIVFKNADATEGSLFFIRL